MLSYFLYVTEGYISFLTLHSVWPLFGPGVAFRHTKYLEQICFWFSLPSVFHFAMTIKFFTPITSV